MFRDERRSESKIKPNMFLMLQIISMLLLSYVVYVILYGLGVPNNTLIVLLSIINMYAYGKFFKKYKQVLKRNQIKKIRQRKF